MIDVPLDFFKENVNRYRALIRGERPDFAPFRLWLDNTFVFAYTGLTATQYARDFETMLSSQKAVNDRFYDVRDFSVDVDTLDIFFDRERYITDFPTALPNRFLESDLRNFEKYYSRQRVSDVPGVRKLTEGIQYFNKRLPQHKRVCHYLGVTGGMDLFSMFRGTANFLLDLYDHPEYVRKIFAYLTERSLEWLEYVERTWSSLGGHNILFDKIDIGEDYAAYLPPDMFDQFVKPFTGTLFQKYEHALRSYHCDGDFHLENLAKLNELGVDEFMGFSPNIDIKDVRAVLPDVILAGNIHPIHTMIEGTPDDVKRAARYCFDTAGRNGKFVLCTGGAISAGAREENVDAFLEACYKIVRY